MDLSLIGDGTMYDPDNPIQFLTFKDFVDVSQFKTFEDFENNTTFKLEKSSKSYDMLKWGDDYGFISLWFNSLTGKLISNFDVSDKSNMSHIAMVHNTDKMIPNPFYIDFSENDIDLYDIAMRYSWIRIGTATSGKEWYVDNKYWKPYMKSRLQSFFKELLLRGLVSYDINGNKQGLSISNPNALLMFDLNANIPIQSLGKFANSQSMGWDMKKHSDSMSPDGKKWVYRRIGDSIVKSRNVISESE